MTTISLNPTEVKMHWTRKLLPPASQTTVDLLSDELKRGTKLPPGYVVKDGERYLLVAGEHRRLAHKARQLEMEFYLIPEQQAVDVALGENANRKQYKYKYQLAWDYCPLAIEVVKIAEKTKHANLAGSRQSSSGLIDGLPENMDVLADRINISRGLMFDVLGVYRKAQEWDKEHDPRKFDGSEKPLTALEFIARKVRDEEDSCTPGQAWAGLAGKSAGEAGKTKPTPKAFQNFMNSVKALEKWGKSYAKFDEDAQDKASSAVKKTVSAWPAELRAVALAELKRAAAEDKEGK